MCILAKHFKISSIVLFILLLACVGWEVLAAENALASKIEFKKVLFSLQSEPKGEGIGGEVLVCQFPENSEWLFGEDSEYFFRMESRMCLIMYWDSAR